MKKILRISAVVATALLCACSTTKEPAKNLTAEELYNQAYDYLEQTAYKKAAETFEKVELEHPYSRWAMIRFPDSKYSADAEKKVKQGIDNLAAHEMTVGRFYLQKQNYLSALNRFSTVIKSYPQTPQIEEALYRQVEIFVILGMNDDAKKAKDTLKKMFPDSQWNAGAQKLVP